MKVSVVVTTTLRNTLQAALESVRAQETSADVETVLVVDRCDDGGLAPHVRELTDKVIWTGGIGSAGARNAGIRESDGDLIAFLDDDDEWLPAKTENQLAHVDDPAARWVLSCRVRQGQRSGSKHLSRPIPTRLWNLSQGTVEEYLFVQRRPSLDRASIYTSTLMVSADLARQVPWQTGLARHQDWDWVMRLTREGGTRLAFSDEPDVIIWTNTPGSISACRDWKSSLDWIGQWTEQVSPQVVADFVAGQPLRYALQARSVRGVGRCIAKISQSGTWPSPGPVAIGLTGLVPRTALLEMLVAVPAWGRRFRSTNGTNEKMGQPMVSIHGKRQPRHGIARSIDAIAHLKAVRPVRRSERIQDIYESYKNHRRRDVLSELIPAGGVGAELGVHKGHLTPLLVDWFQPTKLYVVDPWYLLGPTWDWAAGDTSTVNALARTIRRLRPALEAGRAEVVVADDLVFLAGLADRTLDWVYLDSSHMYDHTVKELDLLTRKVKPGGVIAGDDWQPDPSHRHHGVCRAVHEFAAAGRLTLSYANADNHQWAARVTGTGPAPEPAATGSL